MSPQATADERARLHGPTYGISLAERGLALRCGRNEWTVLLNDQLGPSFRALVGLADRPWIAALVALRYPVDLRATTQYVVLARPEAGGAHLDVVRADGEVVYTGGSSTGRAMTSFSISEVDRPAAAPVRLAGRFSAKGIDLELARAAPRRVGTSTTADAAG